MTNVRARIPGSSEVGRRRNQHSQKLPVLTTILASMMQKAMKRERSKDGCELRIRLNIVTCTCCSCGEVMRTIHPFHPLQGQKMLPSTQLRRQYPEHLTASSKMWNNAMEYCSIVGKMYINVYSFFFIVHPCSLQHHTSQSCSFPKMIIQSSSGGT